MKHRQPDPGGPSRRSRSFARRALAPLCVALIAWSLETAAVAQADYLVGPLDVLSISVWNHPELSGRFTVEADGSLTFPLAGRIAVAGRSLLQVEGDLRERLDDRYVKNPVVTVTVDEYHSRKISIVGEVHKPGSYMLTGDTTLLEALAEAGSTTQFAGTEALVIRKVREPKTAVPDPAPAPTAEPLRIDLERLQRGDLALNVGLEAGDTILIPRGETVFVFGFVNKPGEYVLRRRSTTVLQALALAGGINEQGSTGRLRVVRQKDGQVQELKVELSNVIEPGDTIMVGQRVF